MQRAQRVSAALRAKAKENLNAAEEPGKKGGQSNYGVEGMAKAQAAVRTKTKGAEITAAGTILAVAVDVEEAVEIVHTSPATTHPERSNHVSVVYIPR